MVVPEHDHALGERLVGDQHLLDPPVAQFAALFLDRTGDLQRLAVDARLAFGRSAFGLCGLLAAAQLGWTLAQPARRRRDGLAPHAGQQAVDRGGIVLRLQGADFGRRRAEGGARQQMTRLVEIHRRGGASRQRQPQAGGECRRTTDESAPTDPCDHGDAPIAADGLVPTLALVPGRRQAAARSTAARGGPPESDAGVRAARA